MPTKIRLKQMKIPELTPSYYVNMEEGAFFDLCKANGKLKLSCTSGISGCVSVVVYIRMRNDYRSFAFLNHIESDLPINKINHEINKIETTIRERIGSFDFDDTEYEITEIVIANGFGATKPGKLANSILDELQTRCGNNTDCKYAESSSVGLFIDIDDKVVKLINPASINNLTYIGKRHKGYGKPYNPSKSNDPDGPYRSICDLRIEL